MIKKLIRNVYYDFFMHPLYKLGYKRHYGVWDFFNAIIIETTTYCNLRCEWCPNSKYPRGLIENKKLMDIGLFKKIIDELSKINYRGIIYPCLYGEPLTDNRIVDLIDYIRKKLPLSIIRLSTNGVFLTKEIYKQLVDAGINRLHVNQYTPNILPNVKEVIDLDKESKKELIEYRVFNENLKLCNVGGEVKVKNLIERPLCTYPDNALIINNKGDVILCCNDYHGKIIFGNLNEERLIDVWNKPSYKKIRHELKKGIYNLPICKKCVGLKEN